MRRHSHEVSDELGHLPCHRQGAVALGVCSVRADPSGRVGRGPLATPVHSTDVCNSRFVFQRMTALCLGALRAVFPHATRDRSVHAEFDRFSEAADPFGALSSPIAPAARTSDASSLRGLPDGARPRGGSGLETRRGGVRPPASARRPSFDDPRVVPESRRPPPPSRVNGHWFRVSPRRLVRLPPHVRSHRRPDAPALLRFERSRECVVKTLQCHRPMSTLACPDPRASRPPSIAARRTLSRAVRLRAPTVRSVPR